MESLLLPKKAGRPRNLIPSLWKSTDGGGYIRLNGRVRRLGRHGTEECNAAYKAIVQQLLSGEVDLDTATPALVTMQITTRTMSDLGNAFVEHCQSYYTKNGKPTPHVLRVRKAFEIVQRAGFGGQAITSFGPLALDQLRTLMCKATKVRRIRDAKGELGTKTEVVRDQSGKPVTLYARETVNKYVWCIQQAFRWAVSQEIIEESNYRALCSLPTLKRGRTPGVVLREPVPRDPAPDSDVEAAIAHMSPTIATMVRVQRLAGMRPLEVRNMRACDITQVQKDLWLYKVTGGKLDHLQITREVPLGPKCIALLKPLVKSKSSGDYIFDSRTESPEWKRGDKSRPYNQRSYSKAVERACARAGVANWCPTQLRHALGTEVANEAELDTARRILGHTKIETTLRYTRTADVKAHNYAKKHA